MKAIAQLFASVMFFTGMNRKMGKNWLSSLYNSCKLSVKEETSNTLTYHQQKVANIFNVLSRSSPASMPEYHHDEINSNQESIQSVELPLNIDTPSSNNTQTVTTGDVDMEDEDPEDALRTLSNMKRYKISNLCHLNFFDVGWSKLGTNMKEDRRWAQMLQTQERE